MSSFPRELARRAVAGPGEGEKASWQFLASGDLRSGLAVLVLVPLVVAAFIPALNNGFVNWDDDKNFLDNPFYRGLGTDQWKWAWTTFWFGVYQPLAWVLFEGQYVWWKLDPHGYHLTSLILHAANAVVLYSLTVSLLRRCQPDCHLERRWTCSLSAAMATALFAVHPLRVEPVAWASGQPYLPCALFSMLSVLAYLRAFRTGPSPEWSWLVCSFVLFVSALLYHAVAVSLPAMLLILDVYPLRRFGEGRGRWFEASSWMVLREKVPFVVVSVLFVGLAIGARRQALALVERQPPVASIAQACYGIWFYLLKTVLPMNLVAVYPAPAQVNWLAGPFIAAIIGTVVTTVGLYLLRRRLPGLLAGWLSYLVILAPNSGLIRINDQIAADRYSYLSMMGLAVVAAGGYCWLWRRIERFRPLALGLTALGGGLLLVLICMTREQCRIWSDSRALWTHVLSHGAADSSLAHNNLGVELAREGNYEGAVAQYAEALRLDPGYANPRNGLGAIFFQRGKFELAAAQYAEALRLRPGYAAAHNNLAVVLTRQGKFQSAETHLVEALRLHPGYVSAYNNRGVALASQGKFELAVAQFTEASRLNPDYADAYNNRALIMAACPDAKYRDGPKAVEYATRACKLAHWSSAKYLNTLAAAYAELGDFDAAIRWQTRAMELLTDEHLISGYVSRLGLYQAKKPYREESQAHAPTEVRP